MKKRETKQVIQHYVKKTNKKLWLLQKKNLSMEAQDFFGIVTLGSFIFYAITCFQNWRIRKKTEKVLEMHHVSEAKEDAWFRDIIFTEIQRELRNKFIYPWFILYHPPDQRANIMRLSQLTDFIIFLRMSDDEFALFLAVTLCTFDMEPAPVITMFMKKRQEYLQSANKLFARLAQEINNPYPYKMVKGTLLVTQNNNPAILLLLLPTHLPRGIKQGCLRNAKNTLSNINSQKSFYQNFFEWSPKTQIDVCRNATNAACAKVIVTDWVTEELCRKYPSFNIQKFMNYCVKRRTEYWFNTKEQQDFLKNSTFSDADAFEKAFEVVLFPAYLERRRQMVDLEYCYDTFFRVYPKFLNDPLLHHDFLNYAEEFHSHLNTTELLKDFFYEHPNQHKLTMEPVLSVNYLTSLYNKGVLAEIGRIYTAEHLEPSCVYKNFEDYKNQKPLDQILDQYYSDAAPPMAFTKVGKTNFPDLDIDL